MADESNAVYQKGDAIPLVPSVGPRQPERVVKIPVLKVVSLWRSFIGFIRARRDS